MLDLGDRPAANDTHLETPHQFASYRNITSRDFARLGSEPFSVARFMCLCIHQFIEKLPRCDNLKDTKKLKLVEYEGTGSTSSKRNDDSRWTINLPDQTANKKDWDRRRRVPSRLRLGIHLLTSYFHLSSYILEDIVGISVSRLRSRTRSTLVHNLFCS